MKTRYALISDVHGNLPALEAVISDTKNESIDEFIFVGDYTGEFPYPNEVINSIRSIKNKSVVKGNREGYLENLHKQDKSEMIYEQFAPLYWNYRNISADNLSYILGLQKEIVIKTADNKKQIHIIHALQDILEHRAPHSLTSEKFKSKMEEQPFSHEEYQEYIKEILISDENFLAKLNQSQDNLIICGHTHVQWAVEISGKWLVNPGSCGESLDYDPNPSYTIAEYNGEDFQITEKRVSYNKEKAIEALKSSELYTEAKAWSELMLKSMQYGKDTFEGFLSFVEKTAREHNSPGRPYENKIWRIAADKWLNN